MNEVDLIIMQEIWIL